MTTKRWLGVLGFTIFGILLFASWLLPGQMGFWYGLDSSVFFFFNHLIGQSQALLYLVAFTNLRPFDAVAFLFMLGIFYHYYRQQDAKGRRWMLCIGLTMLVTAVIAKQFDMMLGFERPSATKFFTCRGCPCCVSPSSRAAGQGLVEHELSRRPRHDAFDLHLLHAALFRQEGLRGEPVRRHRLLDAAHHVGGTLADGCRRRLRLHLQHRPELDAPDTGIGPHHCTV